MRHFLFEFITGGGLSKQPLPDGLVREGEMMARTLIEELKELSSDISITRDSRLPLIEDELTQYVINKDIDEKLSEYIKKADVSWLIAPETDMCLEEYAKLFFQCSKVFVSSTPKAIRIAASKYKTNNLLSKKGVKVVETKRINEPVPKSNGGWVVKPDDGVGAEDARLIKSKAELSYLMSDGVLNNLIIQPYVDGEHMSMSLLVINNDVRLLSCNKQYVEIEKESIKIKKIGVNECLQYQERMLYLAKNIVSAIPGLAGYIGVDLIDVEGELLVFEVNPRFTTAYTGLSKSLDCNVAALILNAFLDKKLPDIKLDSAKPVLITI